MHSVKTVVLIVNDIDQLH